MPEHERMDDMLSYLEHTCIRVRCRRNAATRRPLFSFGKLNPFEDAAEGVAQTTDAVES